MPKPSLNSTLVGVDGCHGGWLALTSAPGEPLIPRVHESFAQVIASVDSSARFGVDIPMGLPVRGARACELEARRRLNRARKSSVFPAPPKACLCAQSYAEACSIRARIDGKKISRQLYGILPKIAEVERILRRHGEVRVRIAEVHPEVSFATRHGDGGPMHSKKTAAGRAERRALIEQVWPQVVDRLRIALRGQDYVLDDLHDAFAALWSTTRWLRSEGEFLGGQPPGPRIRRTPAILT